jgi:hypothetical protein
MENNNDIPVVEVQSYSFKQNLMKLAVATVASVIAKKVAEEAFDWMHNRRHPVVTVETITE